MRVQAVVVVVLALGLGMGDRASADSFNGRISFSSFRTDASGARGDIFSFNADGSDLRRLTTDPANDAQSHWSPDGRHLVYRTARPGASSGLEVARMNADGSEHRVLTAPHEPESSSQPSWLPDGSGIVFRRSTSGNRVASIWTIGRDGENPTLRYDPDGRSGIRRSHPT